MIILGPAILFWRINTIVNWIEVFPSSSTMHQIDHTNATNQVVLCSTVLQLYQFDKA